MHKDSRFTDVIDLCSDDDDDESGILPTAVAEKGIGNGSHFSLPSSTQVKVEGHKVSDNYCGSETKPACPQSQLSVLETPRAFTFSNALDSDFQSRVHDGYGPFSPVAVCDTNGMGDGMDGRIDCPEQDSSNNATFLDFMSKSQVSSCSPANGTQHTHLSRRFWKAGDYDAQGTQNRVPVGGLDHVRVHPKFLHSNATSHKWALGAVAELLDNAIDEVRNGATYARIDAVRNPNDGNPMLLVQDNGGGMDPDCMRECMSLGYSRKTSKTTIGQYGNGFKTSTMRLGADAIVFSRSFQKSYFTESIGLLSYTFLRETGKEDIVVPMVDFEVTLNGGKRTMLLRATQDDWLQNLLMILQWSPYKTQMELLSQFSDIGSQGTKVIVYNLWLNDDGEMELDFDIDTKDIQLRGGYKQSKNDTFKKQLLNQHIANRLRFSLRAYASVLYLRMPENFQIILRGHIVQNLSIAEDLKFPECILYKPHVGNSKDLGGKEVSVITTIGFAKEAPMINVHGFNVYHKNRLIMPFWRVFHENSSRGKGVVGVLEANFIEPAHDKQDFERTPILQRLEARLKLMTIEYWNLHCVLIGYQPPKPVIKAVSQPINPSTASLQFPVAEVSNNHMEPTQHSAILSGATHPFAPHCFPISSLCRDQNLIGSPFVQASSNATANMLVDVKPPPSVLMNQLDCGLPQSISLHTRGGLLDVAHKVSLGVNASGSSSAPSTPPQPGSDTSFPFKQLDRKSDQTGSTFQSDGAEGSSHMECPTRLERGSCENGKLEGGNLCAAKRPPPQTDLHVVDPASKRPTLQDMQGCGTREMIEIVSQRAAGMDVDSAALIRSSPCTLSTLELLDEVKDLKLKCKHYEWEKQQLESKVHKLEVALARALRVEESILESSVLNPKQELL